MTRTTVANRGNLRPDRRLLQRWLKDPESVDPSWRNFFEGYELGQSFKGSTAADGDGRGAARKRRSRRSRGWSTPTARSATTWPTSTRSSSTRGAKSHEQLELDGLRPVRGRPRPGLLQQARTEQPLHACASCWAILRQTYCRTIGVEFMHIQRPARSATGCTSGWSRSATGPASTSRRSGGSSTS